MISLATTLALKSKHNNCAHLLVYGVSQKAPSHRYEMHCPRYFVKQLQNKRKAEVKKQVSHHTIPNKMIVLTLYCCNYHESSIISFIIGRKAHSKHIKQIANTQN